jgi:hypothetical protein
MYNVDCKEAFLIKNIFTNASLFKIHTIDIKPLLFSTKLHPNVMYSNQDLLISRQMRWSCIQGNSLGILSIRYCKKYVLNFIESAPTIPGGQVVREGGQIVGEEAEEERDLGWAGEGHHDAGPEDALHNHREVARRPASGKEDFFSTFF